MKKSLQLFLLSGLAVIGIYVALVLGEFVGSTRPYLRLRNEMGVPVTYYVHQKHLQPIMLLKKKRSPRHFSLERVESELLQRAQFVCDWRIGLLAEPGMPEVEPKFIDEIISCLKRIMKSVEKWNKREGRQGYLRFVSQYIL